MSLHVFGIRHHGPGCARSLRAALDELCPDIIVLEGPADAEDALPLVKQALAKHSLTDGPESPSVKPSGEDAPPDEEAQSRLQPPVALLVYVKDEPRRSIFFPLTSFSPEWQTLLWAAEHDIPVRLMDLPMTNRLALDQQAEQTREADGDADDESSDSPDQSDATPEGDVPEGPDETSPWRTDPLAILAEAAGYQDHELWWEQQVERRADSTGLFEAILEAMRTVREEFPESRERDLLREAFMRKTLRAVVKAGHEKVAVVCGAWHAPVLDQESIAGKRDNMKIKEDNARLKGLPKVKTVATWIPWTHSRLSYRSGYGAGIESPGWYAHLWESPESAPTRWIATAARLLREKDLDASSANIIDATRLADSLAAIRELRTPGLAELNEAVLSVLCHGDDAPLRLIRRRLEIGDRLGTVPESATAVPLAQNLQQLQKSLRLKPSTQHKLLEVDLRKEMGLQRSQLLHRLNILGIPWGELQSSGSSTSTFKEIWQLEWQPEFAVNIIEANIWGNTITEAATARVIQNADNSPELGDITLLLDLSILAGLDGTITPLLARIQAKAAVSTDVAHLMNAVLPLARVARYSDVRGTQAGQVEPILVGLFERVIVGLMAACSSLDSAAAESMLSSMLKAQEALDLLQHEDLTAQWQARLRDLLRSDVNGLLRGWACRILLEQGEIDPEELHRLTRLALSPVVATDVAAAWITGLLKGSGLLLIHQDALWTVIDHWLAGLNSDVFVELLPILRRAFSEFTGPERRQMGEKVKHLQTESRDAFTLPAQHQARPLNRDRADKVLPILAHILGVAPPD